METTTPIALRMLAFALHLWLAALSFTLCDARRSIKRPTKRTMRLADTGNGQPELIDASNSGPYGVSSPLSMPPYDSLAPIPLPENSPPGCVYPPFTPPGITVPLPPPAAGGLPPPGSTTPAPTLPIPSPPPGPPTTAVPSPPESFPSPTEPGLSPPESFPSPTEPGLSPPESFPSPTEPGLSPPESFPSPTEPGLSPPESFPSPTEPGLGPPSPSIFGPNPPVFEPPVVYPPPTVPPPPQAKTPSEGGLWCVAKPSVPDPIIQEAMNYACGSGADCDSILPSGSCYQPDTLFAHASYAFNSYWQKTKVGGGTCDFGGTAMLVTVDPSYDGCHFLLF